jgi:hypothetical protein
MDIIFIIYHGGIVEKDLYKNIESIDM